VDEVVARRQHLFHIAPLQFSLRRCLAQLQFEAFRGVGSENEDLVQQPELQKVGGHNVAPHRLDDRFVLRLRFQDDFKHTMLEFCLGLGFEELPQGLWGGLCRVEAKVVLITVEIRGALHHA
jgi:hypothetical protein